ncbi:hypothetical protein [Marinirhabdus gelatinilytica]|uniref:hypothetical protein n=1 Tax=Marinirhabdus gelatinilytica TaxID=1703343 RepID=UPI000E0EFAD4|nr:hypothetical protein [Marinirhabdus gelatinilytica]
MFGRFLKISSLVVLFSLYNCGNTKKTVSEIELVQNPPFSIVESYSQDWVAGTPEGGSGTKVYVKLESIPSEVDLLEVYFKDRVAQLKIRPVNSSQYVGYFMNQTIRPDIIMDSDPIKEAANNPPKKLPFNLQEGEAVIRYLNKGTIQYYKIENLESKEILAYPSSNPKGDN